MIQQRRDPKVAAFMKEHPEIVELITKRYAELQTLSTEELLERVGDYGLKHNIDRVRWELIKAIMKHEGSSVGYPMMCGWCGSTDMRHVEPEVVECAECHKRTDPYEAIKQARKA